MSKKENKQLKPIIIDDKKPAPKGKPKLPKDFKK